MERFVAGDARAFEELYRGLGARLFPFCRRLAGRPDDAEELFQETFFKLHRSRSSFAPGTNVVHWAYAIARTVHLDRLRHRKRRVILETSEWIEAFPQTAGDFASPEASLSASELGRVVDEALAAMPEAQRAAFVLTKEEGLSVAETASILGATENAVKLRVLRAREDIHAAMVKAGLARKDTRK
ncbi:MAG: RNA polymerase sigma factor [Deltaproteobacteria bacterium]|nr:RNA polymerase sigma factor [Deltaproteobacteria bacterium]